MRLLFSSAFHTIRKRGLFRRFCALMIAMTMIISSAPFANGEISDTYLSMYYTDATMEEGMSFDRADEFFSYIAGISIADLNDDDFFSQLQTAANQDFQFRVFVMHENGMPATDLAMLFCFEDSSWLMKNTTSPQKSVYLDVSWEVLQGLNLKMEQDELIRWINADYDSFYECDPEYVIQVYMSFYTYIEESNEAVDIISRGTSYIYPELPEEIESWPLELPFSVQLPKEIIITDPYFSVEFIGSSPGNNGQSSAKQQFPGTVDENNLVTGMLLFWEAGMHQVLFEYTATIEGKDHPMCHDLSVDTSTVRVSGEETCPLYEQGHQWRYEWSEVHPHYGILVCDCGAVVQDPSGTTRIMRDCCECVGHNWKLSYSVFQGKGTVIAKCTRCETYMDVTDSMPDYIRNYLNLLVEIGTEGNTYFEEHDTGDTLYVYGSAPWVYIANQALNRYTDQLTVLKESFVNTFAEPVISAIQLADGEQQEKINIYSKTQLLWIKLIQEMLTDYDQEVSADKVKNFTYAVNIGTDVEILAYDVDTIKLGSAAKEAFTQSVNNLENNVKLARQSLENLKSSASNSAEILAEQSKLDNALKELEAAKQKGVDYSGINNNTANVIKNTIPYVMNAICALVDGMEAGAKVEEMRSAYIKMLNDYSRSCKILEEIRKDAEARNYKDLEDAIDNIQDVLDITYEQNLENYFDTTVRIMDSMGNELNSGEETLNTAIKSFAEQSVQTFIMGAVEGLYAGVSPIGIASIGAKIIKGIANYDEIFDASWELAALSAMRGDTKESLMEYGDQVSPYTLALYAKLESEGCDKAADFVSTLDSKPEVDNIMTNIIDSNLVTSLTLSYNIGNTIIDIMNVDVEEFGIGSNEKETVELMLRKEKIAYDDYVRKCLREGEKY